MKADSESLYFAGLEALTTGNLKEAEHYAQTLLSEGSTMGWELQARLQVLAGLRTEAVGTLRDMLGLMAIGSREEEQTTLVRFMVQLGLLEEIKDLPLDQENVELSVLLGTAADECLKQGKLADCRRFALAAARADHDKHGALWYLSEVNKIQSEGALMRRIVVCGQLELQKKHCAVQHHVVSDTRLYRTATFHGTKKEAEQALRDMVNRYEAGGVVSSDRVSVNAYLQEWLKVAKKNSVAERTFQNYSAHIDRYVAKTIGRLPLAKISVADIQGLYESLADQGLGGPTIKLVHTILNQAFKQAVRWRKMNYNPAADTERPRGKRKKVIRAMTKPRRVSRPHLGLCRLGPGQGQGGKVFGRHPRQASLPWPDQDTGEPSLHQPPVQRDGPAPAPPGPAATAPRRRRRALARCRSGLPELGRELSGPSQPVDQGLQAAAGNGRITARIQAL